MAELPDKNIRLEWRNKLASPVPLPSAQVRQIMLNLLLNAIHAAPHGNKVNFGIKVLNNHLLINVSNGGAAIPERRREHLFEPFFGEGEGHGLGLWVTYQLVQQMGGRIELKSVPGYTCFAVTLPLDEQKA
jgi:signal transduction histidine kinase